MAPPVPLAERPRRFREPFKTLTVTGIRRLCQELTPAALKVWLYQYSLTGSADTSWAKLQTVALATNQNLQTVKLARKQLVEQKFLVKRGRQRLGERLSVPIFWCVIPQKPGPRRVENPPTVGATKGGNSTLARWVEIPPSEVDSKVFEVDESEISSSSGKRDDDLFLRPHWGTLEPKIQKRIEEAKALLLRKGWDADSASAALQLIEERSDRSGTIPSSPQYFTAAADAAMADPRDRAEITKRAERRRRVMPSDELDRIASDLGRESKKSGRSLREIVEARTQRTEAVVAVASPANRAPGSLLAGDGTVLDACPGAATPIPAGDHHCNRTEADSMSIHRNEVNFLEAMKLLDVPDDVLGKLAVERKLKSRRAGGEIYFLREEIDALITRQIEEARAEVDS